MTRRERVVLALQSIYKYALSPALHTGAAVTGACRFQPTCSEYAAIAVNEYGILRGGWMALCRLMRCHPLCKGGFDPVRTRLRMDPHDSAAMQQRPLP
jgi:uncharacterized protein